MCSESTDSSTGGCFYSSRGYIRHFNFMCGRFGLGLGFGFVISQQERLCLLQKSIWPFEEDRVGWCRSVYIFGFTHENYSFIFIPKRKVKWTYKSYIDVAVPFAINTQFTICVLRTLKERGLGAWGSKGSSSNNPSIEI